MTPLNKICVRCGVKQVRDGECWDYDECSKCFVNLSTREIVNAQQVVPMKIVPSIYVLGANPDKLTTLLDQALQQIPKEAHLATEAEIEKANQNLEWVVS